MHSNTAQPELFHQLSKTLEPQDYGERMKPISYFHSGTAFFPGGDGLLKDNDGKLVGEYPMGKTMVLGQDFGTERDIEAAKHKKLSSEREDSATWRNLLKLLLEAGIKPEDCFYTNALMGVRPASDAKNGKSPGWADQNFVGKCTGFFHAQVSHQKPRTILALGSRVGDFLSGIYPEAAGWKKSKIKDVYAEGKHLISAMGRDGKPVSLVLIPHPSFLPNLATHRPKVIEALKSLG